ncbi:MAG: CsbD family protein [Mycobacterium sp.]
MSTANKLRNKLQRVGGKAKETVGRATGDRKLKSRGVRDQIKADVKDVGETAKDAVRGRWGRGGRRI